MKMAIGIINPCPCMSLQKGSKILSIIDAVLGILTLALMILAFTAYIRHEDKDMTKKERNVGLIMVSINVILAIGQVLLAFRLYSGAINRDYRQCKIWLIITFIITTIYVISLIVNVAASDFETTSLAGSLVSVLYSIYEMAVVYAFLQELEYDRTMSRNSFSYQLPTYFPMNTSVYVIPAAETRNDYPMEQLSTVNPSYPQPIHHVTRIS